MTNKYRFNIKPISINECWQGRKFKTPKYKTWREHIGYLSGRNKKNDYGKKMLYVHIDFYLNSLLVSDGDNFVKPVFDALVENGFITDDRYIKRHSVEKHQSDTEYIEVLICTMDELKF